MLRKIASSGLALILTVTLLWGGCLSCAQYFMFPSISAKTCCMPSGHCKGTPVAVPSSQGECRIQALALTKAPAVPSNPVPSLAVSPLRIDPLIASAQVNFQIRSLNQASPPDLCLLLSVFRI